MDDLTSKLFNQDESISDVNADFEIIEIIPQPFCIIDWESYKYNRNAVDVSDMELVKKILLENQIISFNGSLIAYPVKNEQVRKIESELTRAFYIKALTNSIARAFADMYVEEFGDDFLGYEGEEYELNKLIYEIFDKTDLFNFFSKAIATDLAIEIMKVKDTLVNGERLDSEMNKRIYLTSEQLFLSPDSIKFKQYLQGIYTFKPVKYGDNRETFFDKRSNDFVREQSIAELVDNILENYPILSDLGDIDTVIINQLELILKNYWTTIHNTDLTDADFSQDDQGLKTRYVKLSSTLDVIINEEILENYFGFTVLERVNGMYNEPYVSKINFLVLPMLPDDFEVWKKGGQN